MIKTVSHTNFKNEVLESKKPVLVDMWAAWCQPCRAMEPTIEAIAKEFDGRIDVAKLNVDENPDTAQSFGVMSIPTLMLFKDGQPVNRVVGLTTKDRLAGALNSVLA